MSKNKTIQEIEEIELNALLNCIYKISGYDFRQYTKGSIMRNVKREVERLDVKHISDIIPLVVHEPAILRDVLHNLTINVTEFYREPKILHSLYTNVFPALRSFPYIKIWHAGCSSGKEVYSIAILLEEAGLLDRSLIYATDFNHEVLKSAKDGIYPQSDIASAEDRYIESGGKSTLSKYFQSKYGSSKIINKIRDRITFAHHNLVSDSVFGEMQLIICHNVLIYFNSKLKARTIGLFYDSLQSGGYLCLGSTESLIRKEEVKVFSPVFGAEKIWKKVICSELEIDLGSNERVLS